MTPTLRKQLDELKAAVAPEPPTLKATMAHGEDQTLVLEAAMAKYPGVEFGMAVVTRVWGAPVRPELTRRPDQPPQARAGSAQINDLDGAATPHTPSSTPARAPRA